MSKLYAAFLVLAAVLVMAALGTVILTIGAEVGHLAFSTNSKGMNH